MASVMKKLSNERFVSSAPEKVVANEYAKKADAEAKIAAIKERLEALKFEGSNVTIYSDSKYVVEAVNQRWVFGWEQKRFKDKKNPDLWMRCLRIYRRHRVRFVWVKGHDSTVENNRCDELAVAAANGSNLFEDTGYMPE